MVLFKCCKPAQAAGAGGFPAAPLPHWHPRDTPRSHGGKQGQAVGGAHPAPEQRPGRGDPKAQLGLFLLGMAKDGTVPWARGSSQPSALFPPEAPHSAELDMDLAPGNFPEPSGVHHNFPSAFQNLLPWGTLSHLHVQFKSWPLNKQKIPTACMHSQHGWPRNSQFWPRCFWKCSAFTIPGNEHNATENRNSSQPCWGLEQNNWWMLETNPGATSKAWECGFTLQTQPFF